MARNLTRLAPIVCTNVKLVLLLFVKPAPRLCCSLVRHPSDVIVLLHVSATKLDEVTRPELLRLLDSFSHPSVDHLVQRQVCGVTSRARRLGMSAN